MIPIRERVTWLAVGIFLGYLFAPYLPAHAAQPVDLDKLAHAVAVAETGNCTTGMARTKNNCVGIMTWVNGRRTGKTFRSHADSLAAFKKLWARKYGNRFPTSADAIQYAGAAEADTWLANVTQAYRSR